MQILVIFSSFYMLNIFKLWKLYSNQTRFKMKFEENEFLIFLKIAFQNLFFFFISKLDLKLFLSFFLFDCLVHNKSTEMNMNIKYENECRNKLQMKSVKTLTNPI